MGEKIIIKADESLCRALEKRAHLEGVPNSVLVREILACLAEGKLISVRSPYSRGTLDIGSHPSETLRRSWRS